MLPISQNTISQIFHNVRDALTEEVPTSDEREKFSKLVKDFFLDLHIVEPDGLAYARMSNTIIQCCEHPKVGKIQCLIQVMGELMAHDDFIATRVKEHMMTGSGRIKPYVNLLAAYNRALRAKNPELWASNLLVMIENNLLPRHEGLILDICDAPDDVLVMLRDLLVARLTKTTPTVTAAPEPDERGDNAEPTSNEALTGEGI